MKNLILLSLLLLSWNSAGFSFPNNNMQDINLKLSLTASEAAWQKGGKMPVNVAIKNDSPVDAWIKVESIRFHLSPDAANYVRTFIVPKNNTPKEIVLKKGETANQKYELSDLATRDFVSDSSATENFQNLPAGKYKLTVLFQTRHSVIHHGKPMDLFRNFESNISINLLNYKGVEISTKDVEEKVQATIFFDNPNWKKGEKISLNLELKNSTQRDIVLRLRSAEVYVKENGSMAQTAFSGRFFLPIGDKTKESSETRLTIPANTSQKFQFPLNLLPFECMNCYTRAIKKDWSEAISEGLHQVHLILVTSVNNIENSDIWSNSFEINMIDGRPRPETSQQYNISQAGELTPSGEKLLNTALFALGQMSKGNVSLEEVALREILPEKYAESTFKYLILHGSPEGKLYGLVGLKLLQSKDFESELEKVKKTINLEIRLNTPENIPLGKVRMQEGCEVFFEDSLIVIKKIAKGDYDNILETKVDKNGKIIR